MQNAIFNYYLSIFVHMKSKNCISILIVEDDYIQAANLLNRQDFLQWDMFDGLMEAAAETTWF